MQVAERRRQHAECDRHVTADEVVHELRSPFVGNDYGLDARRLLEQFRREIAAGADRRRSNVELARLFVGHRHDIADCFSGKGGVRQQRDRHGGY